MICRIAEYYLEPVHRLLPPVLFSGSLGFSQILVGSQKPAISYFDYGLSFSLLPSSGPLF